MDNVTHTLAGLLVAEAAVVYRRRRGPLEPGFAPSAYLASVIANNLPDLDFLYVGITGGKLGYLLHHRGHTHTLAFAPLAAALTFAGIWLWRRFRGSEPLGPPAGRWLAGLVVLGPLLHLALDSTNNYGIHPFWPLNNEWFYGDGIFIIEPYLWMCAIVGLLFNARRRWAQIALLIMAAGMLALVWVSGFVPPVAAACFTAVTVVLFTMSYLGTKGGRVVLAIVSWVAVTATFFVSRAAARERLDAVRSSGSVVDVVLTPLPANPGCWSALSIEVEKATYRVSRATVAPFSWWMDAKACGNGRFGSPTAPRVGMEYSEAPDVVVRDAFVGEVEELRQIFATECRARAFLRFARAPFWTDRVVGDLRYDRDPDLGFAELERNGAGCPAFVPPWVPPRTDVLGSGSFGTE